MESSAGGMKRFSPVSKGVGLVLAVVLGLLVAVSVLAGKVWADGFGAPASHHVYRVGAAPTVGIHGRLTDVTVVPGPPGEVTVDESAYGWILNRPLGRSVSSDFHTRVTAAGNRVDVDVVGAGFKPGDLLSAGQGRRVVVHVPSVTNLRLLTDVRGGDVAVHGLHFTGPSQLSTTAGDVTLEGASVDAAVKVTTSAGDVSFKGRVGGRGSLQVTAGYGDVDLSLPAVTDAQATASTNLGDFSSDRAWRFSPLPAGSGRAWTADLSSSPMGRIDVASNVGDVSFKAS